MTDFCDLDAAIKRVGMTGDRPVTPLSRQWVFVDYQTGRMWCVNEAMQWYEVCSVNRIVVDDDDTVVVDDDGYVVEEGI